MIVLAFFVVVPLVVATVAALFVRRAAIVAAVGIALAAAFLLLVYFNAPHASEPPCHDCTEHLGRWIDYLVLPLAIMLLVFWFLGLGIGRLMRTFRSLADD